MHVVTSIEFCTSSKWREIVRTHDLPMSHRRGLGLYVKVAYVADCTCKACSLFSHTHGLGSKGAEHTETVPRGSAEASRHVVFLHLIN